jgi:hypothetical protein
MNSNFYFITINGKITQEENCLKEMSHWVDFLLLKCHVILKKFNSKRHSKIAKARNLPLRGFQSEQSGFIILLASPLSNFMQT